MVSTEPVTTDESNIALLFNCTLNLILKKNMCKKESVSYTENYIICRWRQLGEVQQPGFSYPAAVIS